jgi:hypothetical protein
MQKIICIITYTFICIQALLIFVTESEKNIKEKGTKFLNIHDFEDVIVEICDYI